IVVLERDRLMAFMDLIGSKRDRLITVSFMRIPRLREEARMTDRIALEFAPDIWEALGGNTRDLDSILEETGQDYIFARSGFKNMHTVTREGIAIPSDAVRTYKRRC
ncbi:hypothetical protein Tco_0491424, partial [Tanacetum coccineum]